LIIAEFACAYYFLGQAAGPTLSPLGAFEHDQLSPTRVPPGQ
jgi:hypothetical protein